MVISTGVGGVFDSIELYKCKVLDNLYVLYFSILAKDIVNDIVADVVDATYKKLPDKDEFMDFLWGSGLIVDLLLSSLGDLHIGLLKFFVEL